MPEVLSRFDRVMERARQADRVAGAFVPAYRAALQVLVPRLQETSATLCVTEAGGAHPRAVQTTLNGTKLSGTKRWSTAALQAQVLLVCARDGTSPPRADGRPRLVLIEVPRTSAGVGVSPMPCPPFMPEVGHYTVTLTEVEVQPSQVLPGDGYARYIKPFRTVEDVWVQAAITMFLLGVGERSRWPGGVLARLYAQLAAYRELVQQDPSLPQTHLAMEGLGLQQAALIAELTVLWQDAEPALAARWHRDQALLQVAAKARKRRFERALQDLGLSTYHRSDRQPG